MATRKNASHLKLLSSMDREMNKSDSVNEKRLGKELGLSCHHVVRSKVREIKNNLQRSRLAKLSG